MRRPFAVLGLATVLILAGCAGGHAAAPMPGAPALQRADSPAPGASSIAPSSWAVRNVTLTANTTDCASATLSGMNLAQQVGQLFMMGVSSTAPTTTELKEITAGHLGGVVLMGHSTAGAGPTLLVADRLQAQASVQSTAGVALSIAVDQEGGLVQVLSGPGFSTIPKDQHSSSNAADTNIG